MPRSEERRPDRACWTRWVNRARLGRSVSGSCSALCWSCAWRRTLSVTSRLLKMRPPWWRLTVDSTLSQPPVAGPEAALDAGGGFLGGAGGEEAAHLVHHAAQVLRVDEAGQFGADQLLRGAAVDPGGGRGDVPEDAVRRGDHDDVAGALHQGAEVVLLLRQFLGEGDVVEQHDALAHHEGEHDGAAGEEHHAVDAAAVQDVVEDPQRADGGREVGREGGQGAGDGPGGRIPAVVTARRGRVVVRAGAPSRAGARAPRGCARPRGGGPGAASGRPPRGGAARPRARTRGAASRRTSPRRATGPER